MVANANTVAAQAWDTRQLNPYRLQAICEYGGDSIIDVGCGNGSYVRALQDRYRTYGVDIKPYSSWADAPNLFSTCDATKLPVGDKSFDTVTSFEVLEHLPDPLKALREFVRVAQKNIIFSVPNCNIPESFKASRLTYFHYTDPSHVNFFTEQNLRTICKSAGLIVSEVREINPCNMLPLAEDLFAVRSRLGKRVLRMLCRRQYFMTLLVIAKTAT